MKYYLGFDISTSNVGMSVINEAGEILLLKHFSLKISKDIKEDLRLFKKNIAFEKCIIENKKLLFENYGDQLEKIFIEEPLTGSNNQYTASLLQKFNGMASYQLYKIFDREIEFISVHQSRLLFCPEFTKNRTVKGVLKKTLSFPKGIDKKMYILEKISKKYKDIKWIYDKNGKIKKESFDMSDSICVCYSKLIEKGIVKPF